MKILFLLLFFSGMGCGILIFLICKWMITEFGAGVFIAMAVGIYIMFKFKELKQWYNKWQKKEI